MLTRILGPSVALVFAFISTPLQATAPHKPHNVPAIEYHGQVHLHDKEFQHLTTDGPTELRSVKVHGVTRILGPLQSSDSSFRNLQLQGPLHGSKLSFERAQIQGPADLERAQSMGLFEIQGPLSARESYFENIVISSNKITLDRCNVQDITVAIVSHMIDSKQYIYLSKSTIKGNLVFESGNGKVILQDKESSVAFLRGGVLIKEY